MHLGFSERAIYYIELNDVHEQQSDALNGYRVDYRLYGLLCAKAN